MVENIKVRKNKNKKLKFFDISKTNDKLNIKTVNKKQKNSLLRI
jgi:hypothetical protein